MTVPASGATVVVPAHNDAAGLARLLPELAGLDVIVVANGCTDDTAGVARAAGVRVIELPEASKAAALNAGDAEAGGFPRIYLDADVRVTGAGVRALISLFRDERVLAGTVRRKLDVSGRPWVLRGYYAVQDRLPVYQKALFGRGIIGLSEQGRARFETFGEGGLIADDLFLDRLFTAEEKAVADADSLVDTSPDTGALISRLARVRTGTAQQGPTGSRTAWIRVTAPRPWLWPAAVCYAAITLAADRRRKRAPVTWEVAR
ncbi:glycosyltransferase [Longispora albida]|uniref:glycosyltransferase n=1 Tax=Longispora albida TaxID=203523 RepID=UPI00037C7551|nr:glycosyltransferase [Longispora albida]